MTRGIVICNLYKREGSPSVNAKKLGYYVSGDEIEIEKVVTGETKNDYYEGTPTWYKLSNNNIYVWSGGVSLDLEDKIFLEKLELDKSIEDNDGTEAPNFDQYANYWWIKDYDIDKLWKKGLNGSGVKVAVLDTGVVSGHEALNTEIFMLTDVTNSDDGIKDFDGHGTHCSGIVKASGANAEIKGIAYGCQFYCAKVYDDYDGDTFENWIKGIEWATQNKVDIISFSRGKQESSASFRQAIDAALSAGILVLAAAGNNDPGTTYTEIDNPAKYPLVFSIGGVDESGAPISSTINIGQTSLFAPGFEIKSTYINPKYKTETGSSQATPFVAGVVALLLQELRKTSDQVTANDVMSKILEFASTNETSTFKIINPLQTFNNLRS